MRETKRKRVPVSQKPAAEKEVRSLKEEEDLLPLDSDDYDGDSLSGSLHSDDLGSEIFDPEDDGSTEDGEGESSEDEVDGLQGSDDNDDGDESELVDGSDHGSEQQDEESDSSEDEVAPRNTVGDIPLDWYKDEKHIGYDITGKMITKKEKPDKLESFLATSDDYENRYMIYDEYNDEKVELTKEQRMLKGEAPHADFDPHAPYVDWFEWVDARHPLSSAPEPKRRFLPSKSEAKMVAKLVRAIWKGLIKFDKPEEETNVYLLWAGDSTSDQKNKQLTYIPPPKRKLPDRHIHQNLRVMPPETCLSNVLTHLRKLCLVSLAPEC